MNNFLQLYHFEKHPYFQNDTIFFRSINLITGLNNVGKTFLLNCLYKKSFNNFSNYINYNDFYPVINLYKKVIDDIGFEKFINYINKFDSSIKDIKITKDFSYLSLIKDIKEYPLINEGLGLNRVFLILINILYYKTIFIENIDIFLDVKNIDILWSIIFEIYNERNFQLFCTTYSKDCVKYFEKSLKDEGVLLELYRDKKIDKTRIKIRYKEQLNYAVNNNSNYMGE